MSAVQSNASKPPLAASDLLGARVRSALHFRVSSNRQTAENQFEDLLQFAEREDPSRNWSNIRELLARVIMEEQHPVSSGRTRVTYRVDPEVAKQLAESCIYVEQGISGRAAKRRPLFQQMRRDAAQRRFDRLLVWKASRLGRDMREVIATVYDLADLGITVIPVKSQTGPITSTMGKLLWSIQAWYAEMENDERSETIKAGQTRARLEGKSIGRPRVVFRRDEVVRLRQQGLSWRQITEMTGVSAGSARRACLALTDTPGPCQNPPAEEP